MSFLNSFSGQIITGPEKARRGPRVQSISRRPFSIERSLFLRRKEAISVIPSITYLLWTVLSSHRLYQMPRSRMGVFPWVTFSAVPLKLNACGFPRMFAVQARWVQMELCWEMAIFFLFVADGALSVHQCYVHAPGFLPFSVVRCVMVCIQCLIHGF